jgi:type IV pilus assembly protein PilC
MITRMLGEPRIGLRPLAALCRRLSIALGAGVDVRTVWSREAHSAKGLGRRRLGQVRDGVAAGRTISDSLAETGEYFPKFFRELMKVGEQTGHLPEVCRQLAEHYEHQLRMRRTLLASITWPAIELTMALGVVGLVIWLMGTIPALAKNKIDMLGFGLTGTSGLVTYVTFLGAVALGLFFLYRATVRGVLWVAPMQRAIMRIPKLGQALETIALARLAWAMHVTLNSGMELKNALRMSLASTHNVVYTRHIDRVLAAIRNGDEVHEAFRETGVFPPGFLDAVLVGEESGQLVESMGTISAQYQDEARLAMNVMTAVLGVLVFFLIAGIIIFFIFRIFGFYMSVLNDAMNGR